MQKVFTGSIMHHRIIPVEHKFDYSMPYILCDIDQTLSDFTIPPLFSFSGLAIFSLKQEDYLINLPGKTLLDRILLLLEKFDCKKRFSRIVLVSTPRFCSYVFNPVSFILCLGENGAVEALISQVNNTFGECHVYVSTSPLASSSDSYVKFANDKVFHVSPFNEVKGSYEFFVKLSDSHVDIRINLLETVSGEKQVKFRSYVKGKPELLSKSSLLKLWRKHPVGGSFAIPLITYEAAKLLFLRKLSVFAKPIPQDEMTIQSAPASYLERICEKTILGYLSQITQGQLRIEIADKVHTFGNPKEPAAILRVKNRALFRKMILGGDIAFGEGFIADYWESPDIVLLLRTLSRNLSSYDNGEPGLAKLLKPIRAISHKLQHNSLKNSKKNISRHYDLSNDFFATFLDETMSYSCALYKTKDESLKEAQLNKIDELLDSLKIEPSHHLLEIGTGWGALAIRAVERFGCKVTTITLSKEQLAIAKDRVEAKGLQDKINLQLCDYRDLSGSYDRIVSVEMLEAVGHEYYSVFFAKLEQLLAKNGLVALQTITIPDQRYEDYKNGCDWIQKYIFPGGLCPSVSVLANSMSKNSNLVIEETRNIGPHYAKTLKEWRERFVQSWPKFMKDSNQKFDDKFFRMWTYYLVYCEAGFAERLLGTHQFLLSRASNISLPDAPGYDQ